MCVGRAKVAEMLWKKEKVTSRTQILCSSKLHLDERKYIAVTADDQATQPSSRRNGLPEGLLVEYHVEENQGRIIKMEDWHSSVK